MIASNLIARSARVCVVGSIYAGLCLPAVALAKGLECPRPQGRSHAGVLREPPDRIAELQTSLEGGDAGNRVPEIVAGLRQRHPGVENAAIENYLVTAYCPVAARLNGLSRAERQARVDRFARDASLAVYGH